MTSSTFTSIHNKMKHYFTLFLYFTMALFQRELISQHFVLMESYPHNFETTCLVKYLHKNSSGKAKAYLINDGAEKVSAES